MIKKLIKICFVLCILLVVLLVAAFFTLKKMYPPAKLKTLAQNYVSQKLQREFTFDSISFTWIGFTLTNAALSEDHTFAQGTFIKADKLTAHVAVKPLLQRRIEISTIEADGLDVNIVAKKDGSFNFDTLMSSTDEDTSTQTSDEQTQQSTEETTQLVITAQKIRLNDCDFIYLDEQSGLRTALNSLNIEIDDFNANAPFDARLTFTTDISGNGQPTMNLPVSIHTKIFLANFDMSKSYATVSQAKARYKTANLSLQGDIKNFTAPTTDLTGSLSGITNIVLNELAPGLPNFSLPTILLSLKANSDLDAQATTISEAKLAVKDSSLLAKGVVNWSGATPTYNLSGSLKAVVNQLVQMTDTLNGFSPAGTIQATFKATEKKQYTDVSGNVLLQDVSMLYTPFTLTNLNGNIVIASLDNISSSALTGKLNGENFKGSFSYISWPTVTDILLNLNLDKLVLKEFPSSTQEDTEKQATTNSADKTSTETGIFPMNIKANVSVGGITVPYFQSNGMTLSANLTNVTDNMAHTNGTVNFALQPGKITNLDNFIKGSKTAKILLLPLNVIKKAAEFLHINLFPSKNKAEGTAISFTKGAGTYTFTDGVMNIDKTVFNSTVTDVSANGTVNFQTNALNMKAKATLLTQAAPVSFKITGTLNEPKGKLDVVNTVSSVVGGILNGRTEKSAAKGTVSLTKGTATTAATAVKNTAVTTADVVKGIGSLFKKKNKDPEK